MSYSRIIPGRPEPGKPFRAQPVACPSCGARFTFCRSENPAIDACGFNSANYHNPDPVAERQAQATLRNVGAIVLIPRAPLAPGSYTASINAAGQQYTWSFTVSP